MNSSIHAILFDFDGVILDTETPEVQVWKRIYAEYGFEYPVERALGTIGYLGYPSFDPALNLHEWAHDSLDLDALHARHRSESDVLIEQEPIGEGVLDTISEARRLGLQVAVASSSPHTWVQPHLARLGLMQHFDQIVTSDYVEPGRVKPHPDIYLKALELLDVTAAQAIAIEDSLPGIQAAQTAGIFAVAVPNPITALVDLSRANLVIKSLSALPLRDLIERGVQ
jgi:HAD superfamily hydrolase (TIGR01509 family)